MNSLNDKDKKLKLLQLALTEDFSIHIDQLTRLHEDELGDSSEVFFGIYKSQKVFVKSMSGEHHFNVEVIGCELMGRNAIPVPRILFSKEKSGYLDKPLIIETTVEGVSLDHVSPEQSKPPLYESAGAMLNCINQIKLTGFGKILAKEGKLVGESATYKDSRQAIRIDFKYLKDHDFIGNEELKVLEKTHDEIFNLDLPQASVVHADYQAAHIFTDGAQITGVIDFGAMYAGDPRDDIAKAQFYLKCYGQPSWLEAFNRGYGDLVNDPVVSKYALLNAARKVVYRHERNFPARIPQALEVLKTFLAEAK